MKTRYGKDEVSVYRTDGVRTLRGHQRHEEVRSGDGEQGGSNTQAHRGILATGPGAGGSQVSHGMKRRPTLLLAEVARKTCLADVDSNDSVDPKFEAELRRGVLQLVALHYLETPRYGYDLVRLLKAADFTVEEGTLYPILRRFEKAGVLSSRWDTGGKRPRKYYELSEEGRAMKAGMLAAWNRAREATDRALDRPIENNEGPAATPEETGPSDEGTP